MKRVLEVFGEPIINGGQESFAINLVQHFNDDEVTIDFYTPYYCGNDFYKAVVKEHGGEVYEIGLPFTPGKSRRNTFDPLNRLLQRKKYDVVHIHSGSLSILALGAKAASQNNVKTILVHSHSPAEHETMRHLAAKCFYYRTLLTKPTYYLACSENAAKWKFPKIVAKKRTKIINNGIDIEKYQADPDKRRNIRKMLDIDDDTLVIGHVGRFSYEKNHSFILEVFEETIEGIQNAKLLLVGDGELKANIEKEVMNRDLEDKVIFTGSVNDVSQYMQAMDIFVLPSIYEGLPLVGVEAQAAGLPFLVSANVSRELDITGDLVFIQIDDAKKWKEEIVKDQNLQKKDNTGKIREKGFDINETVCQIKKLYCGL